MATNKANPLKKQTTDSNNHNHHQPEIGPVPSLIRLRGVRTSQLPPANSAGDGGDQQRLTLFLSSLLDEAIPIIDSVTPLRNSAPPPRLSKDEATSHNKGRPASAWKYKGTKTYHPTSTSAAHKVDLYERFFMPSSSSYSQEEEEEDVVEEQVSSSSSRRTDDRRGDGKTKANARMKTKRSRGEGGGEGGETWVCRRSVHEDKAEKGTASWDEFRDCFMDRHAETERLFTPSVVRMERRRVWDCSGVPPQKIHNQTWHNFSLCVLEARHSIGRPILKDRIFPILQMICSATGDADEFLVISITVPDFFSLSFTTTPSDDDDNDGNNNNKNNKNQNKNKNTTDMIDDDTVIASYASVERIRRLLPTATTTATEPGRQIEWLMALTSDAGGLLPRWVQNLAVPGQIAKDVSLFLGWIAREREKKI